MFKALGGLGDTFPFSGYGGLGITMLILVPVFYGLAGFVVGALGAVIYNFVVKKFGGLEIELQNPTTDQLTKTTKRLPMAAFWQISSKENY